MTGAPSTQPRRFSPIAIVQILLSALFVPGIYCILFTLFLFFSGAAIAIVYFLIDSAPSARSLTPSGIVIGGFTLAYVELGLTLCALSFLKGIIRPFVRESDPQIAYKIQLTNEPRIHSILSEMCERMKTTLPETILLHADPIFAVTRRTVDALNGKSRRRTLIVGLPLLRRMAVNDFRAIVAHEFAHFTGMDTVYSSFVHPLYRSSLEAIDSLETEINSLGRRGVSLYSLLAFIPLFVSRYVIYFYLWLFHALNMSISRTREKRADSLAALFCGTASYTRALRKIYGLTDAYELFMNDFLQNRKDVQKAYDNFFSYFDESFPNYADRARQSVKMEEECNTTRMGDSHPDLKTRLNSLPAVPDSYSDREPAAELFLNLSLYEKKITQVLIKELDKMSLLIQSKWSHSDNFW